MFNYDEGALLFTPFSMLTQYLVTVTGRVYIDDEDVEQLVDDADNPATKEEALQHLINEKIFDEFDDSVIKIHDITFDMPVETISPIR